MFDTNHAYLGKIIGMAIAAILLIYAIVFLRSYRTGQPAQTGKLQVAASFYPLYFFAQEIGGDRAQVMDITPAGAEPHDYEPTALEMARVENSRLLILNGGGLEAWTDNLLRNIDTGKTAVVIASEGIALARPEDLVSAVFDPHFWLNPLMAKQMVSTILKGFIQADQVNAAYYEGNAATLESQLDQLDGDYRLGLASCRQNAIITSHAAFGRLTAEYGFTQVSITGITPDAEPSPQHLAAVAAFAKNHDIKYIFFESLVSPKLSQTVATEIGAKTLMLNPIEGLSQDDIISGKNYFTEMRANLHNLQTALQCAT